MDSAKQQTMNSTFNKPCPLCCAGARLIGSNLHWWPFQLCALSRRCRRPAAAAVPTTPPRERASGCSAAQGGCLTPAGAGGSRMQQRAALAAPLAARCVLNHGCTLINQHKVTRRSHMLLPPPCFLYPVRTMRAPALLRAVLTHAAKRCTATQHRASTEATASSSAALRPWRTAQLPPQRLHRVVVAKTQCCRLG
jgi:hypothetical protein